MRDPHLRRRPLLARRLASGLPPWAVARGSDMPEDEMAALLFEAGFRELVDGYAGILAMTREARLARMERIAGEILDDALTRRDPNAALFVLRERRKKRDPFVTLAKGFCDTLDREQARSRPAAAGDRGRPADAGDAGPGAEPAACPDTAIDPASDPVAATEAAEAAAAMRPDRRVHPVDAAIWRKATALRQKMLDEQLLHHAVAARERAGAAATCRWSRTRCSRWPRCPWPPTPCCPATTCRR